MMLSKLFGIFKETNSFSELALPHECDRIAVSLLAGDLKTFAKDLGLSLDELKAKIFCEDHSAVHFSYELNEGLGGILSNWQQLTPGEPSRCFTPGYAISFFNGAELMLKASICWACNNVEVARTSGEAVLLGIDAESIPAGDLLAELRSLTKRQIQ